MPLIQNIIFIKHSIADTTHKTITLICLLDMLNLTYMIISFSIIMYCVQTSSRIHFYVVITETAVSLCPAYSLYCPIFL